MKTKFRITTSAYNQIISTVGSMPAEAGGILVGRPDDNIIRYFLFDKWAKTSGATYTFNTEFLNPELKRLYEKYGYEANGMLHSHPTGYEQLSPPDRAYFTDIIKEYGDEFLYTPLVMSASDDTFKFIPFVFHKDGTIEEGLLEIVPDDFEDEFVNKEEPMVSEKTTTPDEQEDSSELKEEEEREEPTTSDDIEPADESDESEPSPVEKVNDSEPIHSKDVIETTALRLENLFFPLLKPLTVYLSFLMCSLWTALFGLFLSLTPSLHSYFKTLLNA